MITCDYNHCDVYYHLLMNLFTDLLTDNRGDWFRMTNAVNFVLKLHIHFYFLGCYASKSFRNYQQYGYVRRKDMGDIFFFKFLFLFYAFFKIHVYYVKYQLGH